MLGRWKYDRLKLMTSKGKEITFEVVSSNDSNMSNGRKFLELNVGFFEDLISCQLFYKACKAIGLITESNPMKTRIIHLANRRNDRLTEVSILIPNKRYIKTRLWPEQKIY